MAKDIFRRAALERLASPEQLDRPVRVVSAMGWIALIGFIAAVAIGLAWVFTARAPVKVLAQGIFIDEGGLFEIVAGKQGRLKELLLTPGMEVKANAIVATFAQTDIERELATAEASLDDAATRYEQLQIFYKEVAAHEDEAENERMETIGQISKQAQSRLKLLREKAAVIENLIKQNVIVRDKRIDIQLKVSTAQERLSTLDDERKIIELRKLDRSSKRHLLLLDEQLKVNEYKRRVARLKDRLAEKQIIRSPHSGIVMEVKVDVGDFVAPGRALATIAPKSHSGAASLLAVLYVAPKDGKRIKAGMSVELIPSTVRPEKYGYMLG